MFEQEVELEKHQSSAVPLLLIAALIIGVVGIAGYFVNENRRVLSTEEGTILASQQLKSQVPPMVHFHTGMVKEGFDETTRDARYRILAKIGVIKIGKTKGNSTPVSLTPKGEDILKQLVGVQKTEGKNNTQEYAVPLAERKLVAVSQIAKVGTGRCVMEYGWQWQPNQLGEFFDINSSTVQAFNTWDRATLINKHGANFYHQAPTKVVVIAVRGDKGWTIAPE